MYVHAHRTKEEIGGEGLEEANGVMGGIRVGGGNGDGNGVGGRNAVGNGVGGGNRDVNVVRVGDGAGTRTGVEANEGAHDGNEDGKRGIRSGRVEERRICAGKPRRVVDMMWKMGSTWAEGEKTKHESIGSVAANQDQQNNKEAGSEAQGTQCLSRNCRCRKSVSSLSRLIKLFCNKYH